MCRTHTLHYQYFWPTVNPSLLNTHQQHKAGSTEFSRMCLYRQIRSWRCSELNAVWWGLLSFAGRILLKLINNTRIAWFRHKQMLWDQAGKISFVLHSRLISVRHMNERIDTICLRYYIQCVYIYACSSLTKFVFCNCI